MEAASVPIKLFAHSRWACYTTTFNCNDNNSSRCSRDHRPLQQNRWTKNNPCLTRRCRSGNSMRSNQLRDCYWLRFVSSISLFANCIYIQNIFSVFVFALQARMGTYTKIFFHFASVFWNTSADFSLWCGGSPSLSSSSIPSLTRTVQPTASNARGNFTVWQSLETSDGRYFPRGTGTAITNISIYILVIIFLYSFSLVVSKHNSSFILATV